MGIDFHNEKNQTTYTTRNADKSWVEAMRKLVHMEGISNVLDVGCGGGIYSMALSDMGVDFVTGVDFSQAILEGARDNCKEYSRIYFRQGNASETGLDTDRYDLLLERALIHHMQDLHSCFKEGYRILKDGGTIIVQDRTPEDCLLEGSVNHIRGYFSELFPRLAELEKQRRHSSKYVVESLQQVGFKSIELVKLWETRRVYQDKDQLLKDIIARTGRSILHELNDEELKLLVSHIDKSLSITTNIVEKDRWTIWKATK